MIQRICRALRPLAILLWKPEPRGRLESKLTAQSHTQFKPTPIGFARSRRFGPDSIREKRPATQEKIAGHYSIGISGSLPYGQWPQEMQLHSAELS